MNKSDYEIYGGGQGTSTKGATKDETLQPIPKPLTSKKPLTEHTFYNEGWHSSSQDPRIIELKDLRKFMMGEIETTVKKYFKGWEEYNKSFEKPLKDNYDELLKLINGKCDTFDTTAKGEHEWSKGGTTGMGGQESEIPIKCNNCGKIQITKGIEVFDKKHNGIGYIINQFNTLHRDYKAPPQSSLEGGSIKKKTKFKKKQGSITKRKRRKKNKTRKR